MSAGLEHARSLLADVLGLEPGQIPDDAGMTTLAAWDSLAHVRIVLRIEQDLGRALIPEEALGIGDLSDIARLLTR
jgi:acyl carrier protein